MSPQECREVLISNAELLMGLKGYKAVSINELLILSQVEKRSFSRLYPSKAALLKDVLKKYAAGYSQAIDEILASPGAADERILRYFESWKNGVNAGIRYDTCLIVSLAPEVPELGYDILTLFRNIIESIISRLAVVISNGKKEGSVISLLDSLSLSKEIFHMWLGSALTARITGKIRGFDSTLKITRSLIYAQCY